MKIISMPIFLEPKDSDVTHVRVTGQNRVIIMVKKENKWVELKPYQLLL